MLVRDLVRSLEQLKLEIEELGSEKLPKFEISLSRESTSERWIPPLLVRSTCAGAHEGENATKDIALEHDDCTSEGEVHVCAVVLRIE